MGAYDDDEGIQSTNIQRAPARPVWTHMVLVPSWALDGEKPGEGRSLQGTWKRVWARLERLGQPVRVMLSSPVVV